jgi:hypothetical protein
MTSLALNYSGFFCDTGMSGEARYLREAESEAVRRLEHSQALFGEKAEAIQQVWTIYNECSVEGWDGYGAVPVSQYAARRAVDMIRALPSHLPIPEITPEPDGSMSLDWNPSRDRIFSVSVGNDDRLSYAWLDGADRGYAVANFHEDVIPARIIEGIKHANIVGWPTATDPALQKAEQKARAILIAQAANFERA